METTQQTASTQSLHQHKDVIESEEIIQFLHPALLRYDYSSTGVQSLVVCCSVLTFTVLYLVSWIFSSKIKTFQGLRIKEQIFWNQCLVRAAYGVFGTIVGVWSLFVTSNHHRDPVFGLTATGQFSMIVTAGFFLYECLTLTLSDLLHGTVSRLLHIHHWACMTTALVIVQTQSCYLLTTPCLALEMTTPFSAVCWLLLKCGQADCWIWRINQMILLHGFHLRSMIECYLWLLHYRHWDVLGPSQPWSARIICFSTLSVFTFLATPYWAYKKTIQLARPIDWNMQAAQQTRGHGSRLGRQTESLNGHHFVDSSPLKLD